MNELLTQLSTILTESPGNLIYHLVLVFSIVSALQVAFNHWRSSRFPQLKRTIVGLSVLLLGQFILLVVSALAWQAILNPLVVLPPLERAITLFSLIWIGWLWLFPEPNRPADAGNALLSLLVLTALALSYVAWMPQANTLPYNATLQDSIWQILFIALIVVVTISLAIRHPNGWSNGLVFMLLALTGHSLHLLLDFGEGNFSGITRIFYLAAFPTLISLPQRFPGPSVPLASQHSPTVVREDKDDNSPQERRRYSTDPKTFHALLALAAEVDADKINNAITQAIAQTMFADLSFLIYLSEDGRQMITASGYDLIREENLEGFSLNKEAVPMLANSLQRGRPLRLPQSSTSPDLQGLGERLNLKTPGHLLSTPIINDKNESIGGVLLLSPYSNRLWNADDQAFLANISSSLIAIIERGQKLDEIKRNREKIEEISEEYRLQIESLRDEKNALAVELAQTTNKATENQAQKEKIESLLALQEETQREIARLQKENEELHARAFVGTKEKMGAPKITGAGQIELELRTTLEEVARLQNQQAKANLRILELENTPPSDDTSEQAAVIASISQELRQPMSSIVGYTDLLLGESVGILGALQRKFVDRIKASTEKLGSLVDNIIQITTLELGLTELKAEPVDLNLIIDNAMAYTSSQAREKNTSIHLELPKILPPIYADTDAIQQILIHLLQNAGAASPVDGTITLRVQNHRDEGQDFILIQVSDTGGGIPAEDLPRVFSRLYRAENVLIQGVGDTGVGLSIAKTLTEAQNGRIWVESEENVGATFSVILPVFAPTLAEGT